MLKLSAAMLAVLVAVFSFTDAAEAARMGGGRSLGIQRQSVAPAARAPTSGAVGAPASGAAAQPVMPAQPAAIAPRAGAPAAIPPTAAAPRTGMSRFLGPIAGIAAGLGIAALLSHFGLPEGFGTFLLLALLAIGVVFIVRALLARRSQASMQYGGSTGSIGLGRVPASDVSRPGNPATKTAWGGPDRVEPVLRANSGNNSDSAGAVGASAGSRTLPAGFDREGFLRQARMQFKQLQGAWDTADQRALANVMTPAMFAEVSRDLAARSSHVPTEVVDLNADVLEVVTENDQHWASVQFTGLLREDGSPTPKPFDETWNLTKPVNGSSGWLLAGIQQNEPAMSAH